METSLFGMCHYRACSVSDDYTTLIPRGFLNTLLVRRCQGYHGSTQCTDEQAYPHLCGGRREEVTSHGATALWHGTLLCMDVFIPVQSLRGGGLCSACYTF
jgi:hypothetical protein